ncbi:MAG TPA: methylenetetrahydrofolate dehydrogenase [Gammaproteobacteria bacterium]|nr:methylenetetrahydrofolate dehydrogenase [Gammaproteobacteria bacterium]
MTASGTAITNLMHSADPTALATKYLEESRAALQNTNATIRIVGFIATDDKPSVTYANATRKTFNTTGFKYELKKVARLDLETEILAANEDTSIHGIFIYFPVFNNQEDNYLRNLVTYTKDIEAGGSYWTRKMSANDRSATPGEIDKKALVPCTPLAIVKILDDLGEYKNIKNSRVTIFNRSEVIGRPLAMMLSNDGADVLSFDVNGPLRFEAGRPVETSVDRSKALSSSDFVITGVPSSSFHKIRNEELKSNCIAVNFASIPNFVDERPSRAKLFVPRVGPMTVAMCMRNSIRLYENFHQ